MFAADPKAVSMPVSCELTAEPADSWKQIVDPVEPFLESVGRRLAAQVESFDPEVSAYAEYALNGQGKHLRPALVALTASAFGKPSDAHVTVAVVIEMVHLATLVHDDIMDEAEIRRGRLTVAANWGNEIAVLFGDCLFANALKLAASFPTPDVCRAVSAATNTVCSGEILQTHNRLNFSLSREEYFRVLEMKTAELFALSCELSAYISGSAPEERHRLREFGLALGTAYQLYDDCVDLFGSEAAAGKSLGTDLAKGKLTLPILILWERSNAAERARIEQLLGPWEPGSMQGMVELLSKHDTLPASIEVVHKYLHKARLNLHKLPVSSGRSGLLGLTEYLGRQTAALGACD
jgi:octaprenyl-diphosphate synthase